MAARGPAATGEAAADAMTIGCEKASCCTSRCTVDENGVHHCMPKEGDACDCGLSSDDKAPFLICSESTQTMPDPAQEFLPRPKVTGYFLQAWIKATSPDQSIPTPPPR